MIPDTMSVAAIETVNVGSRANGIPVPNGTTTNTSSPQSVTYIHRPASTSTTTINAVNSNTFVVKLKPNVVGNLSLSNDNSPKIPKTNLLQLFSGENGNRTFVKALGLGRIVVNRTLLNKNKSTQKTITTPVQSNTQHVFHSNITKVSRDASGRSHNTIRVSIPSSNEGERMATSDGRMVRLSTDNMVGKRPFYRSQLQTFEGKTLANEKENLKNTKDGDDLGGNLANFMNFKLSPLVPKPVGEHQNNGIVDKSRQCNSSEKPRSDTSSPLKPKNGKINLDSPGVESKEDDELTSLSWLTGNDRILKKTIRLCNPDDAGISLSGDESDDDERHIGNDPIFTAAARVEGYNQGYSPRQHDQTFNPNGKPPYSFSCLIFMAVEDSYAKMLPVKEIYSWVCKHFPYFITAPSGWKNSIRHNLSLNKCFRKAAQGKQLQEPGKGSLWCIDLAYRPNLIQALKRTPFYPYLYPSGIGQPLSLNSLANLLPGVRSGRIPSWSPSVSTTSGSVWTDPDVTSAALNLLGLKGNDALDKQPANVRSTLEELTKEIFGIRKWDRGRTLSSSSHESVGTIPLIITSPSQDHTYSTASCKKMIDFDNRCTTPESDKSAPDAAYEFETCGTDMDSEDAEEDIAVSDSEDDQNFDAVNLGDSGFATLSKGRLSRRKQTSPSSKSTKKRKREKSPPARGKRVKYSEEKSKGSKKKSLRVRFQYNKKNPKSSESLKPRENKKIDVSKSDSYPSSDGDSGKDSPKVVKKSRRRLSNKVTSQNCYSKTYKTKHGSSTPTKRLSSSPYSTRSATQTRKSKRISAGEQKTQQNPRISARRRRYNSGSNDLEDEEIKLAAGSLLHLAGFRSPASAASSLK